MSPDKLRPGAETETVNWNVPVGVTEQLDDFCAEQYGTQRKTNGIIAYQAAQYALYGSPIEDIVERLTNDNISARINLNDEALQTESEPFSVSTCAHTINLFKAKATEEVGARKTGKYLGLWMLKLMSLHSALEEITSGDGTTDVGDINQMSLQDNKILTREQLVDVANEIKSDPKYRLPVIAAVLRSQADELITVDDITETSGIIVSAPQTIEADANRLVDKIKADQVNGLHPAVSTFDANGTTETIRELIDEFNEGYSSHSEPDIPALPALETIAYSDNYLLHTTVDIYDMTAQMHFLAKKTSNADKRKTCKTVLGRLHRATSEFETEISYFDVGEYEFIDDASTVTNMSEFVVAAIESLRR